MSDTEGLVCLVGFASAAISFFLFVGIVVAIATSRTLKKRLDKLDRKTRIDAPRLDALARRVDELAAEVKRLTSVRPVSEPVPEPVPALSPVPVPPARPESVPPVPVAAPVPAPPPTAVPVSVTVPEPQDPFAFRFEPPAPPPPGSPTPPPGPPPSHPAPPAAKPAAAKAAPPSKPAKKFDLEELLGVKLFSYVAALALFVAAIFFLLYSIKQGWIHPPLQMAIGILTGIGILTACELRIARRYAVTANALDAAGIAILFATLFRAYSKWQLIHVTVAFGLMVLVTAAAVLLSIRRDSIFIAILGMVAGFATPAMLSTGEDHPFGLFGYLLLLNVGLAWVGYRKGWPLLAAVSMGLTAIYQWGWVAKFLDESKLPTALAIYLVFPAFALAALFLGRNLRGTGWKAEVFRFTAAATAILPLLFATFMAAVPAYGAHTAYLFGFLLLVCLALFVLAITTGPTALHVVGGAGALWVVAIWLEASRAGRAWPGLVGYLSALVLFYLAAPLAASRGRKPVDLGSTLVIAPLLLFAFPIVCYREDRAAEPALLFSVLFVLLAAIAAGAVARASAWIHGIASIFSLLTAAIWSARFLTPGRLHAALLVYGAFGLFYLAVPVAAERIGRPLRPEGSGAVLAFLSLGLVFFVSAGPVADAALWGMALLLIVLNLGLLNEAAAGRLPGLAFLGIVLSWLVIATWWMTATDLPGRIVPSLVVVAGFACLAAFGAAWADGRRKEGGPTVYLALAGHAFLLLVAARRDLTESPWPLLAVLALLDVALAGVALLARRGPLLVGAVVASHLVLSTYAVARHSVAGATIALSATTLLTAGTFAAALHGRRKQPAATTWPAAAAICAFLAFFTGVAADLSGAPPLLRLLPFHAVHLAALLALSAYLEWHVLAAIAVAPAALAGFTWQESHLSAATWTADLALAATFWTLFLAYPVALGRRARQALAPHLAPVLGSAPFFFLARRAMIAGGLEDVIGILPIGQAAILALLLWQLLTIELPGARTAGRLVMVAGAALAFVTLAIPLQLEKQWITVGLALEAAALAWLFGRVPHRGLLAWSAGLATAVFVRLSVNPAVLAYHPRGAMRIWNWYLYTYLVAAIALYAGGALLKRSPRQEIAPSLPRPSTLFASGATVLLFLLLNIEIADYYSTGAALTFNFSADLAQDTSYTIGWAFFALAMLVTGIVTASRSSRLSALVLLVATIVKGFLHDLWRLGGLMRVGSFVGLAVSLALVALLVQRFVLAGRSSETPPA